MRTFEDFPLVRERCQHCRGYSEGVRESPTTGFWCRKHWYEGPRCIEVGCNEPLMRIRDGGDGKKCRAHIFPDAVTDEEREAVLCGKHLLADLQAPTHWNEYPSLADNKRTSEAMRKSGIPDIKFGTQGLLVKRETN